MWLITTAYWRSALIKHNIAFYEDQYHQYAAHHAYTNLINTVQWKDHDKENRKANTVRIFFFLL